MRGLLINACVTLGFFGAIALLGLSKHWWQAVIAAGFCAFFLILKGKVFVRAWRSM